MSDNIIRLSVSEAAKLFGVSSQTVRRAITEGALNYVVVRNRYKISFESAVRWSQTSAHIRNKTEAKGIGQFIGTWKITNKKFSPNPAVLKQKAAASSTEPPTGTVTERKPEKALKDGSNA